MDYVSSNSPATGYPPVNDPNMIYDQQNQFSDELILRMVGGTDILGEVRNYLEGKQYIEGVDRWEQVGEPLMNKKGINDIIALLVQIINRNTIMSGIEDHIIEKVTIRFHINLNCLFAKNFMVYELKPELLSSVSLNIATAVFCALRRARTANNESLGMTIKFLKFTERHVYSFNEAQRNAGQQKGLLNKIFHRGGGQQ